MPKMEWDFIMTANIFRTIAGVSMPKLIYGTAWKKSRTASLVEQAILSGFRGIDTACQPRHYHEQGVGQALLSLAEKGIKREELFLQTKFTPVDGQDPTSIPYDRAATLDQQVKQSFERSKANLCTNYVDSFVLHSPLPTHEQLMTVWRAMEEVYRDGGAHQLGISNCYDQTVIARLFEEADVKPSVLQNRFYRETGYDKDLRAWCDERGIIYQSFWTLTANPSILAHPLTQQLAATYGVTTAQIVFRYLSQVGIAVLTGTTSYQHMIEDLNIFMFDLSSDNMAGLKKIAPW